jgi:hypothetical protein
MHVTSSTNATLVGGIGALKGAEIPWARLDTFGQGIPVINFHQQPLTVCTALPSQPLTAAHPAGLSPGQPGGCMKDTCSEVDNRQVQCHAEFFCVLSKGATRAPPDRSSD